MALTLQPSLRNKHRYLRICGARKEDVERAILDGIGILGWAKAAPFFVASQGKDIILAVDRREVENVKAALALSALPLRVARVSGTLKGLRKY